MGHRVMLRPLRRGGYAGATWTSPLCATRRGRLRDRASTRRLLRRQVEGGIARVGARRLGEIDGGNPELLRGGAGDEVDAARMGWSPRCRRGGTSTSTRPSRWRLMLSKKGWSSAAWRCVSACASCPDGGDARPHEAPLGRDQARPRETAWLRDGRARRRRAWWSSSAPCKTVPHLFRSCTSRCCLRSSRAWRRWRGERLTLAASPLDHAACAVSASRSRAPSWRWRPARSTSRRRRRTMLRSPGRSSLPRSSTPRDGTTREWTTPETRVTLQTLPTRPSAGTTWPLSRASMAELAPTPRRRRSTSTWRSSRTEERSS